MAELRYGSMKPDKIKNHPISGWFFLSLCMRSLLLLFFLSGSLCAFAQNMYAISGKLNIPNKEDEFELRYQIMISLFDSSGKLVGGTVDSALYFRISPLKSGKYTLSFDTFNQYHLKTEHPDTLVVVDNNSVSNLTINLNTPCTVYTEEIAKSDLAANKVTLLMEPGYDRVTYTRKEKKVLKNIICNMIGRVVLDTLITPV
jgi:hypothetical protein